MDTMKTAVVGCGMISSIYIKNFLHLFSVIDLVGVCDTNEANAREKSRFFGVPVLTMEQIKSAPEIRLVVNLTGPAAHASVIRELLEAGKHRQPRVARLRKSAIAGWLPPERLSATLSLRRDEATLYGNSEEGFGGGQP